MCGITGIIQTRSDDGRELIDAIASMRDSLTHRGPDAQGSWVDKANGQIALAHRRLSIIDLSEHGSQPMHSWDARYVLSYNGEIYNFQKLRETLSSLGHEFAGTSDTEVVLAAICQWGVADALKHFEGMFAIAVWDRKNECLFLARDRFGEKPLYYGAHDGTFLFGSELKALREHPRFSGDLDTEALTTLLRHSYIPAPYCIFQHYWKLPAGCYIRVDKDLTFGRPQRYWHIDTIASESAWNLNDNEALTELEQRLSLSVQEKMIADVPVGAFLSGGVDSSLIVALMQQLTPQHVTTFTIGFHDPKIDEASEARETARHLGTDHHELYVSERDLMDVIPSIPSIYDEPFADPSQIPTTLVARIAKQHVTVALSGDGGDELFAGYNRYGGTIRRWHRTRRGPRFVRSAHAGYLGLKGRVRKRKRAKYENQRNMKRCADDLRTFYRAMMTYWPDPGSVIAGGASEPDTPFQRGDAATAGAAPWQWLQTTDAQCYLPEDIMTKVDRAAMHCSLETRAPFLDSRVADLAFHLPTEHKFRDGVHKWLLRQLLYRHVPPEVVERPKRGFGVPLDAWLRGPLREWGHDLLATDRLRRQNILAPGPIQHAWSQHVDNNASWGWQLWCVLMFQAWYDEFFR